MQKQAKTAKPVSAPLWSFTFVSIVLVALFSSINGNGLQNGIVVLVDSVGGPTYLSGYISALFSFSALFARFVSGNLSDLYGRKKICIVGGIVQVVGTALCLLIEDPFWILPFRTLAGFGFGTCITVSAATIADIVPKTRLGEGVGYHGLAFAISNAIGPSMGIIFVSEYGGTGLFLSFSLIVMVATVFAIVCPFKPDKKLVRFQEEHPELDVMPEQVERKGRKGTPKEEKRGNNPFTRFFFSYIEVKALPLMLIALFHSSAITVFMSYTALYTELNGIGGISAFFIVAAGIMIVIRFSSAKLIDRYKFTTLMIPSFLLGVIGVLLPIIIPNTVGLITAGVFYGLACAMPQPCMVSEALRRAPAERRGAASATFYIGCDLGVAFGNVLWGYAIDYIGFAGMYIGSAIDLVIGCIVMMLMFRNKKTGKDAE